MSEAEAKFEEDLLKERSESEQLLLYLGGFDGPIDLLLSLARDQKVDLSGISILALANQYLEFVEKAQGLRLELAADYLVMAAWLAYLKSRLLIPQEEKKHAEPSAQELADALQFQLRRLEAMRKVANDLFHLPRLGYNVFGRGEPEGLRVNYVAKYEMTLYDLLKSYGDIKQRQQNSVYKLNPVKLFSLEEAIERMEQMLGKIPREWVSLFMFLPGNLNDRIVKRSAVASTFGGALEMAKRGLIVIQQEKNYAPIYIRRPGDNAAAESAAAAAVLVEEGVDATAVVENEIDDTPTATDSIADSIELVDTETGTAQADGETQTAMVDNMSVEELMQNDSLATLPDDLELVDAAPADETAPAQEMTAEEIELAELEAAIAALEAAEKAEAEKQNDTGTEKV